MNKVLPWSINGVGFDARESAREAARRQGKSLGEWLHGVIADHAAERGVHERDIADKERIEAVTSKLERLGARATNDRADDVQDNRLRSRGGSNRHATDDDIDPDTPRRQSGARDDERSPEPRGRRRPPPMIEETEFLLEEAIDAMERRALRSERRTETALASFAEMFEKNEATRERERETVTALSRKLSTIETKLTDRLAAVDQNPIKTALSRLEARLDTIGRRSTAEAEARQSVPASPERPVDNEAPIRRLEEKLNAVLEAVNSRQAASPLAIVASQATAPHVAAPSERRLGDAIAEIAQRQRVLDDHHGKASDLPLVPRRPGGPEMLRRSGYKSGPPPRETSLNAVQHAIAALALKIEDIGQEVRRPAPPVNLDALRSEIASMSEMLREVSPRNTVAALQTSISDFTHRIETLRDVGIRDADLRPIETAVGDLRQTVTDIDPRKTIGDLEREVRSIGTKIEDLNGGAAQASALARLQDQTREIHELLTSAASRPLAIDHIEHEIAALGERIDRQARMADARPDVGFSGGADIHVLETMVRELGAKIEAVQAPGADARSIEALQDQISQLSKRFERSDDGLSTLATLERSMRDLFAHLEETRASVETSAAHAAREVLRIAMEGGGRGGDAVARQDTAQDIAALRAIQDTADERTHATLNAVHETLEKVVDRLAVMEGDLAEVRNRPVPLPRSTDEQASDQPVKAVERRPEPSLTPAPEAAKARPQPKAMALGAADPFLDTILGQKPAPRAAKAPDAKPRAKPNDPDDDAGRADYIAAARRAAQTAQTHPSVLAMKRPASADGAAGEARAGLLAKSRDYVATHKKPVLLSLAAIFVIIGTMALVQRIAFDGGGPQMAEGDAPARIAATVSRRAPAASFDIADARRDLTPSALPVSKPAIPAAIPGSDPIQTGSIPSLPAFAAQAAGGGSMQRLGPPLALTSLADAGNGAAEFELGSRYAEGKSVARDFKLAAKWYQKAADQGIAPAQYRLASLYEKGLGVTQDKARARSLYVKAAEAGNPRAMHNLAVLLADGDGKPDYDGAATWFRKAAVYGVHDSQYNLAILLARGLGVQQSLVQSYQWFAVAAAQNDTDAAKKRDEVATKLNANDLAVAKALAASFRPRTADVGAIEVQPPPGGWDGAPASSPLNSARPKISSL